MKRFLSRAVLVLSFVLLPPVAYADAPTPEHVRALLSGFESVPSRATWAQLGPDTVGVLAQLYQSQNEPPFVRLRAVAVAGYYATPASKTFLRAVLHAPGQTDLFVREALVALATAFGADAMRDVRPFVADANPVIRSGAARALARVGTPDALAMLARRQAVETDNDVKEAIRLALQSH